MPRRSPISQRRAPPVHAAAPVSEAAAQKHWPVLSQGLPVVRSHSDGGRQPSERVQKLADEITGLTLLEVADLTKILKVRPATHRVLHRVPGLR